MFYGQNCNQQEKTLDATPRGLSPSPYACAIAMNFQDGMRRSYLNVTYKEWIRLCFKQEYYVYKLKKYLTIKNYLPKDKLPKRSYHVSFISRFSRKNFHVRAHMKGSGV